MRVLLLFVGFLVAYLPESFGQKRGGGQEKIRFEEYLDAQTGTKKKRIRMNLTGLDIPVQTNQFAQLWSQPLAPNPAASANQLQALTAFIEMEGFRLTNTKSELSWNYLFYFSLLEACRDFVDAHGKRMPQLVPDFPMALRVIKTYGILPVNFYANNSKNKKHVDFEKLRSELNNFLISIKQSDSWLESSVMATVRSILNHHLGEPPNKFLFGRNAINPVEFLRSILGFQLEKYVVVTSDLTKPLWKKTLADESIALPVYNLPLDFYIATLNNGIQTGYPIVLQADVEDAGFDTAYKVAIVPSFGLSQSSQEPLKRQYRRDYWCSQPDQPLLVTGYKLHQAQTWFLVRYFGREKLNSGLDPAYGQYVMNQDFAKINSWSYLVAKEALRDLEEDMK